MVTYLHAGIAALLFGTCMSVIVGTVWYWRGRAAQVREFFEMHEAGAIRIQYLGGKSDMRQPTADEVADMDSPQMAD